MSQAVHIVLFWIAVIAAIRLCVWFPESLPARTLFARQGPEHGRGETHAAFLVRRARFYGGWLAQAVGLFAAGAIGRAWDPALGDSLGFLVLWAVELPLLGGIALVAAASDLVRALLAQRRAGIGADRGTAHEARA